jgi:hypothetical protein
MAILAGCSSPGAVGDGGIFVPAAHRTIPPLARNSGALSTPLTLVTITAVNDALAPVLQDFGDALIQSQWFRTVGAPYALPTPTASIHVADQPAIGGAMSSIDIVTYLQNVIGDAGPSPNGSTLYLLYLPDAGSLSDTSFVGYHSPFPSPTSSQGDSYAVVSWGALESQETHRDQLTQTASHEILEAATDPPDRGWCVGPAPAQAWTASVWESLQSGHIEVGDLCEGTRIIEPFEDAGYLYQRIFDNQIALDGGDDSCVPLLAAPYFNVTVAQDWYPVSAGQVVVIPFTGWSSGPTANWFIYPAYDQSTAGLVALADGGLDAGTDLGIGNAAPCFLRPAMNNGVSGTLTVQIPSTVAPGDWAVFLIRSFPEGGGADGCETPLADDPHFWPVGVYVQ